MPNLWSGMLWGPSMLLVSTLSRCHLLIQIFWQCWGLFMLLVKNYSKIEHPSLLIEFAFQILIWSQDRTLEQVMILTRQLWIFQTLNLAWEYPITPPLLHRPWILQQQKMPSSGGGKTGKVEARGRKIEKLEWMNRKRRCGWRRNTFHTKINPHHQ